MVFSTLSDSNSIDIRYEDFFESKTEKGKITRRNWKDDMETFTEPTILQNISKDVKIPEEKEVADDGPSLEELFDDAADAPDEELSETVDSNVLDGKAEALQATLSSLPQQVVNEAQLTISEREGVATYKQKLDVLKEQEEMIADELEQDMVYITYYLIFNAIWGTKYL